MNRVYMLIAMILLYPHMMQPMLSRVVQRPHVCLPLPKLIKREYWRPKDVRILEYHIEDFPCSIEAAYLLGWVEFFKQNKLSARDLERVRWIRQTKNAYDQAVKNAEVCSSSYVAALRNDRGKWLQFVLRHIPGKNESRLKMCLQKHEDHNRQLLSDFAELLLFMQEAENLENKLRFVIDKKIEGAIGKKQQVTFDLINMAQRQLVEEHRRYSFLRTLQKDGFINVNVINDTKKSSPTISHFEIAYLLGQLDFFIERDLYTDDIARLNVLRNELAAASIGNESSAHRINSIEKKAEKIRTEFQYMIDVHIAETIARATYIEE